MSISAGPTLDAVLAITTTSTPEGVANARLMAAAPRMLEALEAVVSWAKTYGLDVTPYRTGCATQQPVIARARAVIAYATGRPVGQGEAAGRPDPLDVLRDVLAWYAESTDAEGDMPPELHARVVAAVGGEVAR